MGKQTRTIEHHYHPPHHMWVKLMFWFFGIFIIFVLLTNTFSWITHSITKDEEIYEDCTYACSKKNFIGTNKGMDMYSKAPILEFDRTDCIKSCNDMYLVLKHMR